nr:hypothetical protein [Mycoplasmopsis bovis]
MSSMPLIAASCENKNPTDESIINNIAPHNSIFNLNLKSRYSKSKKEQKKMT